MCSYFPSGLSLIFICDSSFTYLLPELFIVRRALFILAFLSQIWLISRKRFKGVERVDQRKKSRNFSISGFILNRSATKTAPIYDQLLQPSFKALIACMIGSYLKPSLFSSANYIHSSPLIRVGPLPVLFIIPYVRWWDAQLEISSVQTQAASNTHNKRLDNYM